MIFRIYFRSLEDVLQNSLLKMEHAASAGMVAQKIFFKFVGKLLFSDQLLTRPFAVLATYSFIGIITYNLM